MDPSTGAVLTTASKPSFNPEKLDKIWDDISTDNENSPLLNRATLGLYTPGSTFKIVTTLAYMNQHKNDYNNFSYYCQGRALFHNFKINCFDLVMLTAVKILNTHLPTHVTVLFNNG